MPLSLLSPPAGATVDSLASVATNGKPGNDSSYSPSLSADGRYVAFESSASNLVAGDTNEARDIFVRDLQTRETKRVSISSRGQQALPDCGERGCEGSHSPAISADGRYIAFVSDAPNLVAGDTNGIQDVFVHDRKTGETARVSVNSSGQEALADCAEVWWCGWAWTVQISADGRYVAFESSASNLVAGDANGYRDIFVHDRETGETRRVSESSDGTEADWNSFSPVISADGRYVAFVSSASNLVAGDANGYRDVFVHDRETGETTRVSGAFGGTMPNGYSSSPSLSADGRYVAFESTATNLVAGDGNGYGDVFVHDRRAGNTTRVSVTSEGAEADDESGLPAISADGRYVVFHTYARNLVNDYWVLAVHDRKTGKITRAASSDSDNQGIQATVSADSRYVAYSSGEVYISDRFLKRSVSADVSLAAADTPDPVTRGQELTYTFEVANQGGGQAKGATLVDVLSSGLALTSVAPSQGRCNKSHVLVCRLGNLAPGQSATVTVKAQVRADAPTVLRNTASAQAAPRDPARNNNQRGIRTHVNP
jgi:uncharacterized repeat protein (TIGR01451 family)